MHGRGAFLGSDGTKFDGFWDAALRAGLGFVTPAGSDLYKNNQSVIRKVRYEAAWTVEGNREICVYKVDLFIDHTPKELHEEEQGVSFSQVELTNRDWRLIQTGVRKK